MKMIGRNITWRCRRLIQVVFNTTWKYTYNLAHENTSWGLGGHGPTCEDVSLDKHLFYDHSLLKLGQWSAHAWACAALQGLIVHHVLGLGGWDVKVPCLCHKYCERFLQPTCRKRVICRIDATLLEPKHLASKAIGRQMGCKRSLNLQLQVELDHCKVEFDDLNRVHRG